MYQLILLVPTEIRPSADVLAVGPGWINRPAPGFRWRAEESYEFLVLFEVELHLAVELVEVGGDGEGQGVRGGF